MHVKEVAVRAIEAFINEINFFNDEIEHAAVIGYFEGVAYGRITSGQAWVGGSLRRDKITDDFKRLKAAEPKQEQIQAIREIFAAGMCCEGQNLGILRNRRASMTKQENMR